MASLLLVLLVSAPAAADVSIVHEPSGCMVAGQFSLLKASIERAETVTRARVYFKARTRSARYFVEMQRQDGSFVGSYPSQSSKTW